MKLNFFNFKQIGDEILLTNDFGKFLFVSKEDFKKILKKNIDIDEELGRKLLQTKMIYLESDLEFSSKNKYEMRDIKSHLNTATALHIFVVTTKCNMKCVYCQANNGRDNSHLVMNKEIAKKSIDIALQSPQRSLSFEFQGGEPLINFDIIKYMVKYTEENKGERIIEYNIVTNLTLLTEEIISFFKEYNFGVSTSVDGFEDLHDANRPFLDGKGTYSIVLESIKKLREKDIHVGAIETTTSLTLKSPKHVVRAYAEMGFDTIFLRPLTQLGRATINWDEIGYSAEAFVDFYIKAMDELLELKRTGFFVKEAHATILLKRIFGDAVNYMELRSPCGAATGQLAYYADGNVFTCDEARMLYEMGDDAFYLGNVFNDSYKDLVSGGVCKTVCASSILETIPTCCDCVYQPYCGTCPVVNYASNRDVIEKKPRGYRCKIYSGILDYIFEVLKRDNEDKDVFMKWIN